MIALAYLSVCSNEPSESQLDEIWRNAALKNKSKSITGILLYKSRTFLQVLEGPIDAVETLYDKLGKDSRHSSLLQIYKVPIQRRQYPEWSMAFKKLHEPSDAEHKSDLRNLFSPMSTAGEIPDHLHKILAFFVNEFVNE